MPIVRILPFLCAAVALLSTSSAQGHQPAATVLLVTHPTLSVVRNYTTLVRDKVLDVQNLRIVGIYHAEESEDYEASRAFLRANKIHWMSLRPMHCALNSNAVFRNNDCRHEFETLIAGADGLVLNGGADIQPSLYEEPQSMLTQVETPKRHLFEVSLLVQMLGSARAPDVTPLLKSRPNFPILGICVGMQTLNVAGGGTLIQDIPSQVYGQTTVQAALAAGPASWHRNHSRELGETAPVSVGVMHPVHLTPQAPAFLRATVADGLHEPLVLSIHHQAVDKLAPAYTVLGTSDDGKIIEIIGRQDFPNVLGIQFHPERSVMWERHEQAQMDAKSAGSNFVFDSLAKDMFSRAFNRGIWVWLSERLTAVQKLAVPANQSTH